eukprot:TRINITY_DN10995_c3_g1_i1.p1 TRINITY_DN10995_c3_g1~~TRINITY_DN10995_c3_g1_i1.p1  ORF type:complete len:255 (-),score=26.24 TRINITY_DN10995_c3_g1_i1:146-910(-)
MVALYIHIHVYVGKHARALVSLTFALLLRCFAERSQEPLIQLPPIPCRDDFAEVAQRWFYRTGIAAEIGVYVGGFAKQNLEHWKGEYFMIDAWGHFPDRNVASHGHYTSDIKEYRRPHHMNLSIEAVRPFGDRAKAIRGYSVKVATKFRDNSMDWVFIDAGHRYEQALADLEAWYPKVRWGGLVTGDDYADHEDTELLTRDRFHTAIQKEYPLFQAYQYGVIRAVQEFCAKNNHQLFVTFLNDCATPAWYFVKQ